MAIKTRRRTARKAAPATRAASPAPRRRRSVKTAVKMVRAKARGRYRTITGKINMQSVAMDAAATVAGAVAAALAGQALAKNGVDANISGVVPAAAGALLALKGKSGLLRAVGVGMIVSAGINVVNNMTKAAAGTIVSGDSGLDAIDMYRNPSMLGIPVSPAMLGIPVSPTMAGDNAHFSAPTGWEVSNLL